MCSLKLGLLSAVLALYVALLDVSLWSFGVVAAQGEGQGQSTPAASGTDLSSVRKQIVLRSLDGKPVQGITVQLAPAEPALGGPDPLTSGVDANKKNGITDGEGQVTFTGLGRWVWMASFSGTFQGKDIQPQQKQGRAPYGRTRSGGGFPVIVQAQEEDAPATPVMVKGVQQPEVQPSLFVLVPLSNGWAPSLDLALPGQLPQPLSSLTNVQLTTATATTPSPADATSTSTEGELTSRARSENTASAVSTFEDAVKWLYTLPVGVAMFAFYRAWQERRSKERTD